MIQIIKAFRDTKNDLEKRIVGEKYDFGKKRNESLVNSGFAKFIEVKEQKTKRSTKELKTGKTTK